MTCLEKLLSLLQDQATKQASDTTQAAKEKAGEATDKVLICDMQIRQL